MYRRHTFEERLSIVKRIIKGEGLQTVCKELNIDRYMVRHWVLRYRKYGENGLRGTRSYKYSVHGSSRTHTAERSVVAVAATYD